MSNQNIENSKKINNLQQKHFQNKNNNKMSTLIPVISKEKLHQRVIELKSKLIRPLTKKSAFYHYLPMFGVKSYVELSLNVINPSLSEQIYRK